jgi:hypothetical protein
MSVSVLQTQLQIYFCTVICHAETEEYKNTRTVCVKNGVSNFMFVMVYVKRDCEEQKCSV